MNVNILKLIGLDLDNYFTIKERITDPKHSDLGLSSQFLQSNWDAIIMAVATLIIMFAMNYCQRFAAKGGIIYRLFDHKLADVVFGLVLSNITHIVLPYQYAIRNINFGNLA